MADQLGDRQLSSEHLLELGLGGGHDERRSERRDAQAEAGVRTQS